MTEMHVYLVDDGASYWVAAPDIKTAVQTWMACIELGGEDLEDTDSFSIEKLSPSRVATLTLSTEEGVKEPLEKARVACGSTPGALGCSEWP